MAKRKQTSATEILDLKVDLVNLRYDLNEKFSNFEEKIKYLPTKDEFFSKMDEVIGELQKLRDEVVVTHHLYEKTNKRVDLVDKHLNIDTSSVF